jgi:hypothetical protein
MKGYTRDPSIDLVVLDHNHPLVFVGRTDHHPKILGGQQEWKEEISRPPQASKKPFGVHCFDSLVHPAEPLLE